MKHRVFVSAAALLLCAVLCRSQAAIAQDSPIERRIDSLLSIMTLEEKCGQLNQINGHWTDSTGAFLVDSELVQVRNGLVGSVFNFTGARAVANLQKEAVSRSRLHIPLIFGLDVIHGYRTIFPVPIAEASTWDPGLVERSARVAATEASAAGVQWTFAPMVDIARDPRWGRIVEGSGEDPYLGSLMAAARVRGFQGEHLNGISSILACAKHFAAYGAAEAGRDYSVADISERTLREIYLPPFHAAVDAGAGTLMSSFNEIAGFPSTANRFLLTDILRKGWKFDGFVVSDWTSIEELQAHGIAGSRAEAGTRAINAGCDMDMVSRIYVHELPRLVQSGKVSGDVVNESVRRILREKFRLGLFDDPVHGASPGRESSDILSQKNLATALESARKAIVLLKNSPSILPLSKNTGSIALIGPLADDKEDLLGPWDANGKAENVVTVLEGCRKLLGEKTRILFAKGCGTSDSDTGGFAEAVSKAREAEAVILVMGESREMSGEASSRSDIGLPGVQRELLQQILETGKPVVLVLMNGRPLTLSWESEHVPAILETWYLGVQAGNAIAEVIFGDVNPSGKLPVTFPRSLGQVPLYYNHKNTGRPYLDPKEKYASRYLDAPNTPQYPFGFGLSYTKFEYSDFTVDSPVIGIGGNTGVSVKVTNTGTRDGEEVVQLYIQDVVASITRPVKELKAFRRIALKPGESSIVRFTVTPGDLTMLDSEFKPVIEPGLFLLYVGGNSADCLEQQLNVAAQ
jgi:beta-glucosidase